MRFTASSDIVRTVSSALDHLRIASLLVALALLQACATAPNNYRLIDQIRPTDTGTARVVVMPLDVELSKLTAGGLLEPQAEWTQNAVSFMKSSITTQLPHVSTEFYEPTEMQTAVLLQLQRLHQQVGQSMTVHQVGMLPLPSKKGRAPDWSLGSNAAEIGRQLNADYALFFYVRDSYATGGRVGMMLAMSLLGVSMPMGQQVGFASLVDLSSGDVVWFNHLLRASGDLRTQEAANATVTTLLSGFPGKPGE